MITHSGHETDTLRILVADGRRDVRSALRLMLEQDEAIVVSAEAANSAEVMMRIEQARPDVVILDCDLPGLEARELLPAVRSICPRLWVVAMCTRPEVRESALSAGADAFVGKTDPPQRLLSIVRQGLRGRGPRAAFQSDYRGDGEGRAMGTANGGQSNQTLVARHGGAPAAWGAEYLPDRETVVVNGSGRLSLEDLTVTARGAADLLLKNRASRMLLDCSEAILDVKVLDVFYLPECYRKFGVPPSAKIALVLPRTRQSSGIFEFYETVCRNKGYTCKLFQNQRSAEQWLA